MELWLIITIVCVSVVLLALIVLIFLLKGKKKSPRVKVDEGFMLKLIECLGNKENIKDVNIESGRLLISVNDLEVCKLDGIKELATNGVFVTGNVIKTLFRLDSLTIKKELEKRI